MGGGWPRAWLSYGFENSSSLSALARQPGAASRASRKRSILARAAGGLFAPQPAVNTPQVRFTLRVVARLGIRRAARAQLAAALRARGAGHHGPGALRNHVESQGEAAISGRPGPACLSGDERGRSWARSEEHTSELQSPCNLV